MDTSQNSKFSMGAWLPLELESIVRMITSLFKNEVVCYWFRLKCLKTQIRSEHWEAFYPFIEL